MSKDYKFLNHFAPEYISCCLIIQTPSRILCSSDDTLPLSCTPIPHSLHHALLHRQFIVLSHTASKVQISSISIYAEQNKLLNTYLIQITRVKCGVCFCSFKCNIFICQAFGSCHWSLSWNSGRKRCASQSYLIYFSLPLSLSHTHTKTNMHAYNNDSRSTILLSPLKLVPLQSTNNKYSYSHFYAWSFFLQTMYARLGVWNSVYRFKF